MNKHSSSLRENILNFLNNKNVYSNHGIIYQDKTVNVTLSFIAKCGINESQIKDEHHGREGSNNRRES